MTPSRRWRLLALAVGVAVVAVIAVVAVVRVATTPKAMSVEQFEAMLASGSVVGVSNTITEASAKPEIDLESLKVTYLDVASCTSYWAHAKDHLLRQASALPVDPETDFVDSLDFELWDDPAAARAAVSEWSTCFTEVQAKDTSITSPVKVVGKGTTGEVTWRYTENLDALNPVRLLVLSCRNVIVTLQLPDAPPPVWRGDLAALLQSEVVARIGG